MQSVDYHQIKITNQFLPTIIFDAIAIPNDSSYDDDVADVDDDDNDDVDDDVDDDVAAITLNKWWRKFQYSSFLSLSFTSDLFFFSSL